MAQGISTHGIVGNFSNNYDLVISQYDNRKHDLYDEQTYIIKAEKIKWIGDIVSSANLIAMKSTHN